MKKVIRMCPFMGLDWEDEEGKCHMEAKAMGTRIDKEKRAHRNTAEQLVRTCRVRHTPNALHAYTATLKGRGVYGWGDTPAMARDCLRRMLKYDDGPNAEHDARH